MHIAPLIVAEGADINKTPTHKAWFVSYLIYMLTTNSETL